MASTVYNKSTLPIVNFKGPRENVNYEEKLTAGRVFFLQAKMQKGTGHVS